MNKITVSVTMTAHHNKAWPAGNPPIFTIKYEEDLTPQLIGLLLNRAFMLDTQWVKVGDGDGKDSRLYCVVQKYEVTENTLYVCCRMESRSIRYRDHLEKLGWTFHSENASRYEDLIVP